MSIEDLFKKTTINIQEKANLIWAIANNFRSYLNHFSTNVIDILEKFDFDKEISKLDNNGILYNVIQEFCSKKAYMEKNVLPFQPKAKIIEKQPKIGYENPFTREFYKYVPLEAKETELMNKNFGR